MAEKKEEDDETTWFSLEIIIFAGIRLKQTEKNLYNKLAS